MKTHPRAGRASLLPSTGTSKASGRKLPVIWNAASQPNRPSELGPPSGPWFSSPSGEVDANGTYFYWKRWLDGLFVVSEATRLEKAEPSNCVVFQENTAKEFDIEWAGNLKNGWTGVSGVQIVVKH
jgi:hypothetical protein